MPVTIIRQPQAAKEYRKPLEQWRQYVVASDWLCAGSLPRTRETCSPAFHRSRLLGNRAEQPQAAAAVGACEHVGEYQVLERNLGMEDAR